MRMIRKWNKSTIITALLLILLMPSSGRIYAGPVGTARPAVSIKHDLAQPMASEVYWVYRYHRGVKQKRLWSASQNKWLTSWINV